MILLRRINTSAKEIENDEREETVFDGGSCCHDLQCRGLQFTQESNGP
jgi:hypothetical protein